MLTGLPAEGPPSCSLVSTLIPLIDFVALRISSNITNDGRLLSQSLYSRLIEPMKSSDDSDCSEIFPLRE